MSKIAKDQKRETFQNLLQNLPSVHGKRNSNSNVSSAQVMQSRNTNNASKRQSPVSNSYHVANHLFGNNESRDNSVILMNESTQKSTVMTNNPSQSNYASYFYKPKENLLDAKYD